MSADSNRPLKIACLGWGSLIWDPRELPICREWFKDGPLVPVEFTRRSSNRRMTLVIDPSARPVRVLWAVMLPTDLQSAKKALKDREEITATDWLSLIGSWERGDTAPENIPDLPQWAEDRGLDAAVWTALKPKFGNEERSPSIDEVIRHLRELSGTARDHAKKYIERAPRQIDTEYRRQIEADLGWSCRENF
jgi:hypothetical protein